MVKVGDKIKIIGRAGYEIYNCGETYEVIALNKEHCGGVYIRTQRQSVYDGKQADRPIQPPFSYVSKLEYELAPQTPPAIKVGDKVRLIDKPWESAVWGKLCRERRAMYSNMKGQDLKVKRIYDNPDLAALKGIPCADTGARFVPLALLERVENKAVEPVFEAGKKYVFDIAAFKDAGHDTEGRGWPRLCEGREVYFESGAKYGRIDSWLINRNWCREVPAKHRYTPEQEQEAREIVYRLIAGLTSDDGGNCTMAVAFFVLTNEFMGGGDIANRGKKRTFAYIRPAFFENEDKEKYAVAFCSPDDEWSDDIGRMVAICKLLSEPLPAWVRS